MKKPSQNLLALQALRRAGPAGVHSFELNQIIHTNYSPRRIGDLRSGKLNDTQYNIKSKTEKCGDATGVRYFLQEEPKPVFKWEFDNVNNIAKQVRVG